MKGPDPGNCALMTTIEEFAHDARTWAFQTIIFTLQHRLPIATSSAQHQHHVQQVSRKSAAIRDRLWESAETPSPDLTQMTISFIGLVLEWTAETLRGTGFTAPDDYT